VDIATFNTIGDSREQEKQGLYEKIIIRELPIWRAGR
jgi:hypothetical protein